MGHDVLLDVLIKRFDVVSKAFDKSYLSEHTQSFCLASGTSNLVRLACSVPQGSVIGPVKFIAYTENIPETVDAFQINNHLYADDPQLQDHMRIATTKRTVTT